MLALADRTTAAVPGGNGLKEANAGGVENCGDIRSGRPQKRMLRSHKTAEESLISSPTTTPQKRLLRSHKTAEESLISSPTTMPPKRMLRSHTTAAEDSLISSPSSKNLSPVQWKSPRRCISCSPNSPLNGNDKEFGDKLATSREFLLKKSWDALFVKSRWNPRDSEQMRAVKEALHVSTMPSSVVCREDEQARVLSFCKLCVEQEKSGSLYICGCPGTGKTMIMEKVKQSLNDWSKEEGIQQPDVLSMNCTSLTNASEVFCKILQKIQPQNKTNGSAAALKHIQNMYSGQGQSSKKLLLLIIDELDYLITKDRAVLHELFMLTTLPFSRFILVGIANAIDLADRFLPKLRSLNCKPTVLTFRAYSKDQMLRILQDRLLALPYRVFQPQALELCARKVAAASGDMRKALCVCRCAIEMLEAETKQNRSCENSSSVEGRDSDQPEVPASEFPEEGDMVQAHHMAVALSKTYRSPVVETIQSLPQHQQTILCSAVKLFHGAKKVASITELNKSYEDVCKSMKIWPVGISELSSICRVLIDQGILKGGQPNKIALKVDAADIKFALQGIRFFRNCLE